MFQPLIYYMHFNSPRSKSTWFGWIPKFGNRKPKIANALKVSTFLPNKFGDILKTLPADHYVLCVLYTEGDVQIGITGAKHSSISPIEAACQEVLEELRMQNVQLTEVDIVVLKNFENTYYVGQIGQPAAFCEALPTEKPADGIQRKVAVLIHGTKTEVVSFMNKMPRGNGKLNDNICSLVAVPVPDARNMADMILEDRKNTPKGQKQQPFWYSTTSHGKIVL